MRSINLSEEEIKTLKEFIAITVRTYGDAYHQGKVSFKNYNRMDNILSRLYNLKKAKWYLEREILRTKRFRRPA